METVFRYLFGKFVCKIIGHKPDKEMFVYEKFCCDRCHLIRDLRNK